ncbi:MAG: hypothetical protein Q8Q05_00105 [bacterium]|nr:hypothetical protein [bacterium]
MIKFKSSLLLLVIVLAALGLIVTISVWLAKTEAGISFTATPLTLEATTAQPGILAQQSTSLNWLDPTSGQSVKKLAVEGLNDVSTITYDTTNTEQVIYKVSADGKYLALASSITTVLYGYPYSKKDQTEAAITIVDLANGEAQTVVKFDSKTALVDIAWDFSTPDVIGFATLPRASLNNHYEIMPMEMLYPGPSTNLGNLHLTRLKLRTTESKTIKYELSNGYYSPMLMGLNETKFWLINNSLTSVSSEGVVSQESAVVSTDAYYNSANFGNLSTNNDHSVVALTADYKIVVYWLKTGQKQELSLAKTGSNTQVTSLAVSRTGTEIAFVGQASDYDSSTTPSSNTTINTLWYYNLDTGSSQKLTSWTDTPTYGVGKSIQADLISRSLVWSPDGKQLAAMLPKSDTASPLAQSELKVFTIGESGLPTSVDLGAVSTRLIRWQ